jgi:hypothetical protein
MKKFLTLVMVAVFVFTAVAVTYAIDFQMSGLFRTRTRWGVNYLAVAPDDPTDPTSNTGWDDSRAAVDSRIRLKVDAVASEDLMGELYLQADGVWGLNDMATFGAGNREVKVKNAFVKFKVPGTDAFPTTATVGVQGFYLARFGVDDDAAGITADLRPGPAELRVIWIKELEDEVFEADDVDSYGFRVTFPVGEIRPGLWGQWSHYGKEADAALGVDTGGDLYWVGLTADGKVGPVSFLADFVYNAGSTDYSTPISGIGTLGQPVIIDEDDYGGWVFHAKASVPVGEMFEVGGLLMYASGDDLDEIQNDGEYAGFRQPHGGASFRPTQVYYGSSVNDAVGWVSRVGQRVGARDARGGLAGDWVAQGFFSLKPLDWLKVTLLGAYIGDNVDNGDRVGTAEDFLGRPEDNSDVGFEVDLVTDIQIYKELTWSIGAGFLFAGDAMDQVVQGSGAFYGLPYNLNESPNNPWAIVSQLLYSF